MKFLLDANIPRSAIKVFQDKGHDVVHVVDTVLKDATDARIAQYAYRDQRAIVTRDLDFADVRHYPPAETFGYLVVRVPDTWIASEINRLLVSFLEMSAFVEHIPRHLVVLEPSRVRFRPALEVVGE